MLMGDESEASRFSTRLRIRHEALAEIRTAFIRGLDHPLMRSWRAAASSAEVLWVS
jgi:hypothetical protein